MNAYRSFLIVSLLIFTGCDLQSRYQISPESIKVIPVNQRAYVNEHCRKLLIQNKKGHIVDEETLFCDPNASCNSSLFDTDATFTLIDCNGQWYLIDKRTGNLEKTGRKWQTELPENYLGTYKNGHDSTQYQFISEENISAAKVYTINAE